MAKNPEEVKKLLESELFRKGIAKKYIGVSKDFATIRYNCKNETERKLKNPEEFVQATSYLKLIFEYNYLPKNISINTPVQMGAGIKKADILCYNEENNKVLIVVECKEEGISEYDFEKAVNQAYSYARSLSSSYIWVTCLVKNEYFKLESSSPLEKKDISDIPKRNESFFEFYRYIKGKKDPTKETSDKLNQKFKSVHDAIWDGGKLDPLSAFDELNKLIFCKIWDENWQENNPESEGKPYDFQIIHYSEDKDQLKAKTELEKRIQALYKKGMEKDPEVFEGDISLDKNKIFAVVKYLQDIHLSHTDLDAKGLAYQSFIGKHLRGNFGQFFTPSVIVQFIVKAIGIKKEYKVLDTSCGSGSFLLCTLKEIRKKADELFTKKTEDWFKYWHNFAEKQLFGIEINEQISRIAKMNMIIHDDGHTNIINNDGLENKNRNSKFQDGTFNLIMTNPPFGAKIKADEKDYYKEYELFEKNLGITGLNARTKDNKKWRLSQCTEVLFLERCYKYLKEEGYLVIVIPDGILTNFTNQYVRDWLVKKFRIIAVVSLPKHTFNHVKAGVKSSILFLKKYPNTRTKDIESFLCNIKSEMERRNILDEDAKKNLYKDECRRCGIQNYDIMIFEVENIGYDSKGKNIDGNELEEVADCIQRFIKEGE